MSDLDRLNKSLNSNSGHCRIQNNLISRRESEEQLVAVFELIDDKEIEAALAVLDKLNGKHGYPKFDASNPNDDEYFGYYDLDSDLITLRRNIYSPTTSVLLHVVGRWGYVNILTSEDRYSYWRLLEKYYGRNNLDKKKLRPLMPWQQQTIDGDNLLEGPDEFFAYQFEMWAWQKRMPTKFQSSAFWRKNTPEYHHSSRRRIMDAKRLDPDLNDLFAQILPDD